MSEWSEWSSCYAMKNECDPGIQIRIKTCLKNNCKDEPKEVRKCSQSTDVDLVNFCSNNTKKLGKLNLEINKFKKLNLKQKDIWLDFKNKKSKEKNSNLTQSFNLIDLSKSNRLKSFVIDINWLKNNDRINFTLHSSNNAELNGKFCLQIFVMNQIQHEISILNLNSKKRFLQKKLTGKNGVN